MKDDDITKLTLGEVSQLLRRHQVSPVDLLTACLARIRDLDPVLRAFITVMDENALQQAHIAEDEIMGGQWRGPLHGIPIALKDLIDVAGVPTTAASRVFERRIPQKDAEVVRRLKLAGAVLIGKTNLHEFAFGGSSVVGAYGPVFNPLAPQRIAGGSSGGSAAAVASGMCYAALGTDTAGSIRLPAAFCGVAGLKPTYGLVSAHGVIPLSWSLDHVGPIARTVEDVALMLAAIAGYDPEDVHSREFLATDYVAELKHDVSNLRIGIAREYFFEDLEPEIGTFVNEALLRMEEITAGMREVSIPVDSDRTVFNAEVWAYHQGFAEGTPELYQPETLRRIQHCAGVSATDYIRARQHLEGLRRSVAQIFQDIDVLVTPTVPVLPPTVAELLNPPDQLRGKELTMLRNTRPFNVLGLPAITISCGTSKSGLPIGLQLVAAVGAEKTLLAMGNAWEPSRQ